MLILQQNRAMSSHFETAEESLRAKASRAGSPSRSRRNSLSRRPASPASCAVSCASLAIAPVTAADLQVRQLQDQLAAAQQAASSAAARLAAEAQQAGEARAHDAVWLRTPPTACARAGWVCSHRH